MLLSKITCFLLFYQNSRTLIYRDARGEGFCPVNRGSGKLGSDCITIWRHSHLVRSPHQVSMSPISPSDSDFLRLHMGRCQSIGLTCLASPDPNLSDSSLRWGQGRQTGSGK
eukprot:sb/3477032/